MTKQEYTDIIKVWVDLQMALSIFDSPESHFPNGKEQFLRVKLEEAYAIVDKMVAKGKSNGKENL